jgi:hypothetical protein
MDNSDSNGTIISNEATLLKQICRGNLYAPLKQIKKFTMLSEYFGLITSEIGKP